MSTPEERKLATKQRIFDAAEQLFAAQGFDNTTVAEVAQRAEVAKGTFFLYFPAKSSLLAAIGNEHLSRALDTIEAADRRDSWPFSRQVDHVFRTLARAVDSAAETMAMIAKERAYDAAFEARLHDVLADLIKSGKRSSDLRADVLADRMAAYLLGVWRAALAQWADPHPRGTGGNFERWLMESVRLAFDGLTPR